MCVESTLACVISIIGMMDVSTYRTPLACICRVYILNLNACKLCFVFYILCKSIESEMPKVGASVLVVHLSNGSAMGIVAGTYWNSSHRPPVSGKGVYRKDLAQAIGEAFLQYSGSSLQIHAPAITLDASRITLATKSGSITVAEIINHIKG